MEDAPFYDARPLIRYSPHPLEHYTEQVLSRRSGQMVTIGIGTAKLLKTDPLAWNLAWMSHDFDRRVTHYDPHFLQHVDRTARLVALRRWLSIPAPAFAYRVIRFHRAAMARVPLYKAYGDTWLDTLIMRGHQAQPPYALDPVLDRPDLPIEPQTSCWLDAVRQRSRQINGPSAGKGAS